MEKEAKNYFDIFYAKTISKISDYNRKTLIEDFQSDYDEEEEYESEKTTDFFGQINECISDLLEFPHISPLDEENSYNTLMINHFSEMHDYIVDFIKAKETEPSHAIILESDLIPCIVDLYVCINEPDIEYDALDIINHFIAYQKEDVLNLSGNEELFSKFMLTMVSENYNLSKITQKSMCLIMSLDGAVEQIPYEYFESVIMNFYEYPELTCWFCRLLTDKVAIKSSQLPIVLGKITDVISRLETMRDSVYSDMITYQKNIIISLKNIIPQFKKSDPNYNCLEEYIGPSVINFLFDAKFGDRLIDPIFSVFTLLMSRNIMADMIVEGLLCNLSIVLSGCRSNEREKYILFALEATRLDHFIPDTSDLQSICDMLNCGTINERMFSFALIFLSISKGFIEESVPVKRVDDDYDEEEVCESLCLEGMPFDIVENVFDFLDQCKCPTYIEEIIYDGLDVLLFKKPDFVEEIITNDLEETFRSIIESKDKRNDEIEQHIENIAATITMKKRELEDD